MTTPPFDPTSYIRENFNSGPLDFFRAGKYLGTAESSATVLYKDTVSQLSIDDTSSPELRQWCENAIKSEFLLLETTDIREYWDEMSIKQSSFKRGVTEMIMHNTYSKEYGEKLAQGSSSSQIQKKQRTAVAPQLVQYQAESTDSVMVSGSSETIGFTIKNEAITNYSIYHQSNYDRKTVITIIDLDNIKNESQRLLFTDEQWNELQAQFPPPALPTHRLYERQTKYEAHFNDISKFINNGNFAAAFFTAHKREYKARDFDEATMYNVLALYINMWRYHAYIFDPNGPELSEADFIVKVWGPIIEAIFRDSSALRCAWGETHCAAAKAPVCSEREQAIMKADLRVVHNNAEYTTGEFCKAVPSEAKVSTDRTKLLVEGKFMLNKLINVGITSVYLLQISALQLRIVALTLVADGLYAAHTIDTFHIPTSKTKLKEVAYITMKLLSLKDVITRIQEHEKSERMEGEIKTHGLDRSTTSQEPTKTTLMNWARETWVPPHDHTLPSPPSSFTILRN
ncbi:hypothetical protein BJV82DRAFT_718396 [Fennellomyces sp. T-0311]|nr:hypothetical protein BJV82DRAFT_718396 [Fennellomyces sp. T-0311]